MIAAFVDCRIDESRLTDCQSRLDEATARGRAASQSSIVIPPDPSIANPTIANRMAQSPITNRQ
jgi:hypothetical protein